MFKFILNQKNFENKIEMLDYFYSFYTKKSFFYNPIRYGKNKIFKDILKKTFIFAFLSFVVLYLCFNQLNFFILLGISFLLSLCFYFIIYFYVVQKKITKFIQYELNIRIDNRFLLDVLSEVYENVFFIYKDILHNLTSDECFELIKNNYIEETLLFQEEQKTLLLKAKQSVKFREPNLDIFEKEHCDNIKECSIIFSNKEDGFILSDYFYSLFDQSYISKVKEKEGKIIKAKICLSVGQVKKILNLYHSVDNLNGFVIRPCEDTYLSVFEENEGK